MALQPDKDPAALFMQGKILENNNNNTNAPSEEVRTWKKRNAWIVFWGIVACAIIIAIAYQ